MTSPDALLSEAQELSTSPDRQRGVWPRTTAFLLWLALERTVQGVYQRNGVDVGEATLSAQLLALPRYVDEDLAEQAAARWAALSRACHQHPYDLPPSGLELAEAGKDVQRLVEQLGRRR